MFVSLLPSASCLSIANLQPMASALACIACQYREIAVVVLSCSLLKRSMKEVATKHARIDASSAQHRLCWQHHNCARLEQSTTIPSYLMRSDRPLSLELGLRLSHCLQLEVRAKRVVLHATPDATVSSQLLERDRCADG